MAALNEQLQRSGDALKRSTETLQRHFTAYIKRLDGASYLSLVEALAMTEATRMEFAAIDELVKQQPAQFEVTLTGSLVLAKHDLTTITHTCNANGVEKVTEHSLGAAK